VPAPFSECSRSLQKTPEKSSVRDYFDALSIELHLSVAQTVGLEPTTVESIGSNSVLHRLAYTKRTEKSSSKVIVLYQLSYCRLYRRAAGGTRTHDPFVNSEVTLNCTVRSCLQSKNATFRMARDSFSVFMTTLCQPCKVIVAWSG
jgi:hypothetical protein